MTKSYINSRTINHVVIYSYTVLYVFNQQLTNPFFFYYVEVKGANPQKRPIFRLFSKIQHYTLNLYYCDIKIIL